MLPDFDLALKYKSIPHCSEILLMFVILQTFKTNSGAHQLVPAEFVGEHRVGGSHGDAREAYYEVQHAHLDCS